MCPSRVAAYNRPSGPLTRLVYIAVTAPDTAFSNAAGPLWLPVAPVVNTIEYGANGCPFTSRTAGVTAKRYSVFGASAAVGDRLMTSPPPLVITLAATAVPSATLVRVTLVEVRVEASTPPEGSRRSSTTLPVVLTLTARLVGVLVRTEGMVALPGTLATST